MAVARARLEGCAVVLASATPSLETASPPAASPAARRRRPAGTGWHPAGPPRRCDDAGGAAGRPAPRPPAARRLAVAAAARGADAQRSPPASSRCCSSTAAATRRSPCAAPAATGSPARTARPGWSRIASAGGCTATIAATPMPTPEHCPSCGAVGLLTASGPGVERLAEELARRCCRRRASRVMTSDTHCRTPTRGGRDRQRMDAGAIDVLLGTQIIAKGHHFPDLTLVGVVDADLGLGGGDLRAAERTFQLLYQVAGRAGREERPGRVLIQTHLPEHPVMQALAAGDKDRFLAVELEERRVGDMPPFGRLAALILVRRRRRAGQGRGAPARPGCARDRRRHRPRPGAGPAGAAARPLPRAPAGQGRARPRPAGLAARLAGAAKAAGRAAPGRHRPDELPLTDSVFCPRPRPHWSSFRYRCLDDCCALVAPVAQPRAEGPSCWNQDKAG